MQLDYEDLALLYKKRLVYLKRLEGRNNDEIQFGIFV